MRQHSLTKNFFFVYLQSVGKTWESWSLKIGRAV